MDEELRKLNVLENLDIMINYLTIHRRAGHDFTDPEFVMDLYTTLDDLHAVLDCLGPRPTVEERVSFLVREVVKIRKDVELLLELHEETSID